ncbi:terminase gpA endonuclease subunit, partial [Blastomonas sp.]
MQAKKRPETLQPFVNTILGQPWKTEGEDFDEQELF